MLTTTYYITDNGNITAQYELDENGNIINAIEFIYDSNENIIGFIYADNIYFYIKNVQGDVTNIVDEQGNVLVDYYYNAWGVTYSSSHSNLNLDSINPITYRSYYKDFETGFYYLQSRYYIPTFCRFLNSDLPEYAQMQKDNYAGTNLFVYCCNDPINNVDYNGNCFYAKRNGKKVWSHDTWEYSHKYIRKPDPKLAKTYDIKGRLNVDTDGADSKLGSDYWNRETAYKINSNNIDAKNINYIVSDDANDKGKIAVIINRDNKKIYYAIVADIGNAKNEFSYHAVNAIYPRKYGKKWNGNDSPEQANVVVMVFHKSKGCLKNFKYKRNKPKELQDKINECGKIYYNPR